jgi:hypothetical protein
MIMLMIAAVVADMSASAAVHEMPSAAQPEAGTAWVLPDLDYGSGNSCPPLIEKPLNERIVLSIGPNCGQGQGQGNRPDPVGSILPED